MPINYEKLYQSYQGTEEKKREAVTEASVSTPPVRKGGFMSTIANMGKSVLQSTARPFTTPVAGVISGVTGKDVDWGGWGKASLDLDKQARIAGGAALDTAALIPAGKGLQALRAGKGVGMGALALREAGYGAITGAASAAGTELGTNEEATLGDVFVSGLIGAGIGAAAGAASPVVARSVGRAVKRIKGAPAVTLVDDASKLTVREKLAGVEPSLKSLVRDVGKEEPGQVLQDFDRMIRTAKEAAMNPRKETPLEAAGASAEKALTDLRQRMQKVGNDKSSILARLGGRPIDGVKDMVASFDEGITKRFGGILEKTDDGARYVSQKGRRLKIDESDAAFLSDIRREFESLGEKPSAQMVDDAVDYLQGQLYKRTSPNVAQPTDDAVIAYAKQAVEKLNEIQQSTVGHEYMTKNQEYRELIGVFDWLNKNLGREGSKGGALMKRVFSPSDAGTKKMFEKIRELTGVDLIRESSFAKLAMELAGDARQAGLLEQMQLLSPGAGGSLKEKLIQKAVETVKGKIADPEKVIRQMIEKGMNVAQ